MIIMRIPYTISLKRSDTYLGIGIIFIGVVAYIVVQSIVRDNGMGGRKKRYGDKSDSADNYFFPGANPNIFTGDINRNDDDNSKNSGHHSHHGHHSHNHGGSSWSGGHDNGHGGHGGWDSGGGDSGGGGGDSGGGGGGD
ncbi:hypothetical protein D3C75_846820 [compost metagenome]